LTGILNDKQTDRKLTLFEGLLDELLELMMGMFDQCLGQLTPAEVAQRVSSPSEATKLRFRTRVRQRIYKSASEYAAQGGKHVADSVLEATAALGETECLALVKQLTEGENWFPNEAFITG
jgi:hypothetical protein